MTGRRAAGRASWALTCVCVWGGLASSADLRVLTVPRNLGRHALCVWGPGPAEASGARWPPHLSKGVKGDPVPRRGASSCSQPGAGGSSTGPATIPDTRVAPRDRSRRGRVSSPAACTGPAPLGCLREALCRPPGVRSCGLGLCLAHLRASRLVERCDSGCPDVRCSEGRSGPGGGLGSLPPSVWQGQPDGPQGVSDGPRRPKGFAVVPAPSGCRPSRFVNRERQVPGRRALCISSSVRHSRSMRSGRSRLRSRENRSDGGEGTGTRVRPPRAPAGHRALRTRPRFRRPRGQGRLHGGPGVCECPVLRSWPTPGGWTRGCACRQRAARRVGGVASENRRHPGCQSAPKMHPESIYEALQGGGAVRIAPKSNRTAARPSLGTAGVQLGRCPATRDTQKQPLDPGRRAETRSGQLRRSHQAIGTAGSGRHRQGPGVTVGNGTRVGGGRGLKGLCRVGSRTWPCPGPAHGPGSAEVPVLPQGTTDIVGGIALGPQCRLGTS